MPRLQRRMAMELYTFRTVWGWSDVSQVGQCMLSAYQTVTQDKNKFCHLPLIALGIAVRELVLNMNRPVCFSVFVSWSNHCTVIGLISVWVSVREIERQWVSVCAHKQLLLYFWNESKNSTNRIAFYFGLSVTITNNTINMNPVLSLDFVIPDCSWSWDRSEQMNTQ